MLTRMSRKIESACPSCGAVAERETYDIGSGDELSCASCEWCWGADGQHLKPLPVRDILAELIDRKRLGG